MGLLAWIVLLVTGCERDRLSYSYYGIAQRIEAEDLVWIEVVPTLAGKPKLEATVAAGGVDLELPWVGPLEQVNPNGRPIRFRDGELPTRCFLAPAGCTLALAVFHPDLGTTEREWTVPAANRSGGRKAAHPLRVQVPLPETQGGVHPPKGKLKWVHRSGRTQDYVDRRGFELRSARYGLLLQRREVSELPGTKQILWTLELPTGDYRALVTPPVSTGLLCGTGPPTPDWLATQEIAVQLQPGEERVLTTQDGPSGPLRLELVWAPGKKPASPKLAPPLAPELTLLNPALGRPGVTVSLLSEGDFPIETRLAMSGFGLWASAFHPSTPVGKESYSRRALPSGDYEVLVRGAGVTEERFQVRVEPRVRGAKSAGASAPQIQLSPDP